jgi:RimJ/RimL family protein N-acetyltransferase
MRLRAARRGDYERIIAVQPQWWAGRDLTGLIQPLFLEHFASTSLILEDGDDLVAFLLGFPSTDDPDEAYVHFVGVAPRHRGTGLGRRMHEAFAEQMGGRGVVRICCVTSPVNTASVAFHESIGFVVEEADERYVHLVRELPGATAFVPRVDPRPDDAAWPTAQWPIDPTTVLERGPVRLRLATPGDGRALFAALDHDACWTHVRGRPESEDDVVQSILDATRQGRWMWTVERAGEVVGTTSFLEVSPVDARLEIGFTVYAPSVWGSDVNPACKFVLMQWAFDHGFGRVQLKTDIRNARSQQAIARLGATYEGVLRRYQRRQDGSVRDTVVFSITAEDWPRVRAGLLARLA